MALAAALDIFVKVLGYDGRLLAHDRLRKPSSPGRF
jgi:hypothetical protein